MAEPTIRKKTAKRAPTYESSPTLRKRGSATDPNMQTRQPAAQYNANTRVPSAFQNPPGGAAAVANSLYATPTPPRTASAQSAPSGGFGAGGGTAAASAGSPAGGEALTGFAGRHFTNADLPTVWQNPWLIVNAALDDRGMGNNIKLKELMREYGEFGLPIFTMLAGLTDDVGALGSSETINWISQWINSMTQLGGHVPSYEQLLGQLLQGRGTDTILGEALNSGTAQDQINTLMTYIRAALGTNSLNPIAGSAVLSQANREADNFLEASMGGQDGYTKNLTDWINSGGHRLFGS